MKVTRIAAIALIWLMVLFGLSRCDEQEYDIEDSKSPNQDFDDYSSMTSSDSKTFNDGDNGDNISRNRPYPIDLKQLPALPTDVLAGLLQSDLFQITVTIPPTGSALLNQLDLSNIDILPPVDGALDLNLDGLTSLVPFA